MNSALTTAQVLQQFLPLYRRHHRLTPQQAKVTGLLCRCRTEALGGYRLACDHCGFQSERYRSCHNRHCPQCQRQASDDWLSRRREDLLPVPYFHLVFTLPHALNPWVQLHPEVIYAILFQSVWATLQAFGEDPKRLDGQLGMTAVLHTWGQNLSQHVHLHCLIPGGAYQRHKKVWHPARSTYLFPVRALSRHYRGRMVSALRRAYERGELPQLTDEVGVNHTLNALMAQSWVVYARSTCHHSDTVLVYLSRYTHRIAISDRRLQRIEENSVVFDYKDYRSGGMNKRMQLPGEEFVRRLLLHVLPHGLMRIRHYGFLANCHRRARLAEIRECLQVDANTTSDTASPRHQGVYSPDGQNDVDRCPRCHRGTLQVMSEIVPLTRRRRRSPTI